MSGSNSGKLRVDGPERLEVNRRKIKYVEDDQVVNSNSRSRSSRRSSEVAALDEMIEGGRDGEDCSVLLAHRAVDRYTKVDKFTSVNDWTPLK